MANIKRTRELLQLSFENSLADRLEAGLKRIYKHPVWVHGGRKMTSVRALTRILGLGEERDFFKIIATVQLMGERAGFETVDHIAPSDAGGLPMPKDSKWETTLVYLDMVEAVVKEALPIKGPKKLTVFRDSVQAASLLSTEMVKERARQERAIEKAKEKLAKLQTEYELLLAA